MTAASRSMLSDIMMGEPSEENTIVVHVVGKFRGRADKAGQLWDLEFRDIRKDSMCVRNWEKENNEGVNY